jgi:cell division protein FtsZ
MTLHEVDEAANRIREEVDADANIIFGSTFDATMQGRMRVSVVSTGISAMAAQQPAPNYLSLDMNRPMQTGQPALSRPAAPPVGRVAMPTAATAIPAAPMAAAPIPAAPIAAAPMAPPPAPMAPPPAPVVMETAPMAAVAQAAPIAEAPIPAQIMTAPPVEVPVAAAAPAPVAAPVAAPPIAATAPAPAAPAPQRPLVDENDWRVSRPPMKAAVRASEPATRPMAARPVGGDSRSPNLFQRITGAFSAPKPATAAAAPAEPPAARPAPENVVAVAPKPVVRAAPVQTSISLDVTERAKPARDDDDLQIPAFLRRQAN